MLSKLNLLSLILLAGTSFASIVETKTNSYIQPAYYSQINSIFGSEPPAESGIKVVFVYECAPVAEAVTAYIETTSHTLTKTEDLTYKVSTDITSTITETVCENKNCAITTTTTVCPTFVDSVTQVTYTTIETTENTIVVSSAAASETTGKSNNEESKTNDITTFISGTAGEFVEEESKTKDIDASASETDASFSTIVNTDSTFDSEDVAVSKSSDESFEVTSNPILITSIAEDLSSSNSTAAKTSASLSLSDFLTISISGPVSIPSAPTTTSTIFSATSENKTRTAEPTLNELSTTQLNPVTTQPPVSSSQSITINATSFSRDLTVVTGESTLSSTTLFNNQSSNETIVTIAPGTTILNSTVLEITSTVTNVTLSTQFTVTEVTLSSVPTATNEFFYSNNSISSIVSSLSPSAIVVNSSIPVTTISSTALLTTVITTTSSTETTKSASTSTLSQESSSFSSSDPEPTNIVVRPNVNNYSGDAFKVIDTSSPPSIYPREPIGLALPAGVDNEGSPIQTNKFYGNLYLGNQKDMIWSWPYGLFWRNQDYYGFGVQHTNVKDRQFGSQNTNNPDAASYYFNPTGNAAVIFSSSSLTKDSNYLFVTEMESMSVNVKLASTSTIGSDYVEIPIVQGMGFVTGIYHGDSVPVLNSLMGFKTLTKETSSVLNKSILKYRGTLFSGIEWIFYVTLPDPSVEFELTASSPYKIVGSKAIDGLIIQVAVAPTPNTELQKREGSALEGFYDSAAGMYVVDTDVVGTVSGGSAAQYGFSYATRGQSNSGLPIVFAFPHHVESLISSVAQTATGITLPSTTKGEMSAFLTDKIIMSEAFETDMQFLPWSPEMTKPLSYTADQLNLLVKTANEELQVNIADSVASMGSMYFSGKVLDKYAYILLVLHDIIQDEKVTKSTLEQLKEAIAPFINNKETYPLIYDTKFGGVTSSSAQNGDTGLEFGATYYNDHHFHYGYFVHAAALIGKVDKELGGDWAETNKDWVNSLVRDVANPSKDDPYFPVSRSFDWFAGHSWAAGLFASGDGKNQESSSEDYHFSYGMKLWGNVIGDGAMESRGDLMLAITKRAMNRYYYYKSDNTDQPKQILPNKVAGILFENKVTYTTFFGSPDTNPEFVHGIHMLPITPASALVRIPSFVEEEWKDQISTFIDRVDSGWTGILKLNQALYDPETSYEYFSSEKWTNAHLDNGQSRTWSLAFAGGVANSL